MRPTDPQFDRRLASIFQAEAAQHLQRMQGCLADLESGGAGAQAQPSIALLFRAAHSLKGAARAVARPDVEALCHAMENVLAGLQRGRLTWSAAAAEVMHDAVAALAHTVAAASGAGEEVAALLPRLRALEGQPAAAAEAAERAEPEVPPPPAPAESSVPPPEPTVRIGVERLASLLHDVEELVALKLGREQFMQDLDAALAFADSGGFSPGAAVATVGERRRRLQALKRSALREQWQLDAAVDTLLATTKAALLQPAATLSPFLFAAVRELSRSQAKQVELRLTGDDLEMDRRVLDLLREPLTHLLRNALFHGIEPVEIRTAAGKPPKARLEVAIAPQPGGRVVIRVSDDGAGIDTARLRIAAAELGLPLPDAPEPADLLALVFSRGLSTAQRLTHVAGRGMGLAIVRETVERMGGHVSVSSTPDEGTTFTLVLPLSLATFRAIEVRSCGRSFLLPTSQVERCLRVDAQQVRTVGTQQSVPVGEQSLPLASLAALLELPQGARTEPRLNVLVLHSGERRVALVVQELVGEQEVLSKPVEPGLTIIPIIAGAAALGGGRTVPILNGAELVRAALRDGGRAPTASWTPAPRATSTLLLAEDSITSRTLLKNILEVAGYRVEVAGDGAQALEKLRAGAFDLVVSDVEMPNMDGIALTEAVRADPRLSGIPVVLVTSLGSPADRERGAEAGANAYIVKSSFDQGNLLQAIEELL